MLSTLSPKSVFDYEKESKISFFTLLEPSIKNMVDLLIYFDNKTKSEAMNYVMKYLKGNELITYFNEVMMELEKQGYIDTTGEETEDSEYMVMFSDIWKELEPYAISIGVSGNDFWTLDPEVVKKVMKQYRVNMENKEQMEINNYMYLAKLVALGVNAPDKMPKEPPKLRFSEDDNARTSAEENHLDEQANRLRSLLTVGE